jgi:hypothetical protein
MTLMMMLRTGRPHWTYPVMLPRPGTGVFVGIADPSELQRQIISGTGQSDDDSALGKPGKEEEKLETKFSRFFVGRRRARTEDQQGR